MQLFDYFCCRVIIVVYEGNKTEKRERETERERKREREKERVQARRIEI